MTAVDTIRRPDAELLRSFRDLFPLTLDAVGVPAISRRTHQRSRHVWAVRHQRAFPPSGSPRMRFRDQLRACPNRQCLHRAL